MGMSYPAIFRPKRTLIKISSESPSTQDDCRGYCQQMDTHLATATVREALLFSAKMRQPPSIPDSEKEAYVEQCLIMCGLENYADAIVGSLGVEHRKRTTIGVELAAKVSPVKSQIS